MGPPKTTSSKRWRPTAEQVMILKGLFKAGVTTPSAQQIQRITTQLKEYGKVETKNVFYWFQNHKARDKQKKLTHKLHHHNNNVNNNHLLYCFYLPTAQQPSGIFPIFPAQATSDVQWRMLEKPEMTTRYYNSGKGAATRDGCSSMDVTWLTTDSEFSHQQRHQERLKTLQLFPTSSSS